MDLGYYLDRNDMRGRVLDGELLGQQLRADVAHIVLVQVAQLPALFRS